MGHVRLARLPATRRWKEVVELLTEGGSSYEELASLSAEAAEQSLKNLTENPVFIEAVWLLSRIPQAAKEANFEQALQELGIPVRSPLTVAGLLSGFSQAIEKVIREQRGKRNDFGEMAKNAGIAALSQMIQKSLPKLWSNHTPEDVRHAVASLYSSENFSEIAQEFFSGFTEKHLRYYLDRELPKHVGPGKYLPSLGALDDFNKALHAHCQESSVIMQIFARDWRGKKYHQNKLPTRKSIQGFTHITLDKMRKEFKQRRMVDA